MRVLEPARSKRSPIDRPELHRRLRVWLVAASDGAVIGDVARNQGRAVWVWIRWRGEHYRLHADTKRAGVQAYLALVDSYGEDVEWTVVRSQQGRLTRVVVGPDQVVIPGLFLYRPETEGGRGYGR